MTATPAPAIPTVTASCSFFLNGKLPAPGANGLWLIAQKEGAGSPGGILGRGNYTVSERRPEATSPKPLAHRTETQHTRPL